MKLLLHQWVATPKVPGAAVSTHTSIAAFATDSNSPVATVVAHEAFLTLFDFALLHVGGVFCCFAGRMCLSEQLVCQLPLHAYDMGC